MNTLLHPKHRAEDAVNFSSSQGQLGKFLKFKSDYVTSLDTTIKLRCVVPQYAGYF